MHGGPERNYKSRDPLDVNQGLFKLLPTTSSIVIRIQILFCFFPISITVYHKIYKLSTSHHACQDPITLQQGAEHNKARPFFFFFPQKRPILMGVPAGYSNREITFVIRNRSTHNTTVRMVMKMRID